MQLPLPPSLVEEEIINAINPSKDVDGLHPLNLTRLFLNSKEPYITPCTPLGCFHLISHTGLSISGKRAVVIGRSRLVGKPMGALLTNLNATVTVCHSYTANLEELVREADILVVAVGKKEVVKGEWIKEGSCVIDVGINQLGEEESKRKITGDVGDFETAV